MGLGYFRRGTRAEGVVGGSQEDRAAPERQGKGAERARPYATFGRRISTSAEGDLDAKVDNPPLRKYNNEAFFSYKGVG